jgi:dihydrofolate reductase
MRVSIYMACSVDGFAAGPDDDLSFLEIDHGGEDYGQPGFFASVDALVMGRTTLETVLGFGQWPYAGMRVFVASSTLTASPHPEATLVSGDPATILAKVGEAEHVWVDGPETGRRFLAAGLVHDITVTTIPVVLGAGTAFFGAQAAPIDLELVSSRTFVSGVVQTVYAPRR